MAQLRLWFASRCSWFLHLLGSRELLESIPFLEVFALISYYGNSLTYLPAFVVGLICPHEGGFAIKLTEKIEDLVTVLFLPLYFALSGLGTNIGLLNDGITWAYVIGVIAVAFMGKIIGGTLAARACKLVWRESLTIGVLMSCKGLVELIVLVSVAKTVQYYHELTSIEHRFTGQDSLYSNFYHICCHGARHDCLDNSLDLLLVSYRLPKEAGSLEER